METVKALLVKDGKELMYGIRLHERPLPPGYKSELDTIGECRPELTSRQQQTIGIFKQDVELGRIDIFTKVLMLLKYQAASTEGHLEVLYLIVHYSLFVKE